MTREELFAKAQKPAEEALRLYVYLQSKTRTAPKCPIGGGEDFSIWYTPGVAAPCRAIQRQPDLVYGHTKQGEFHCGCVGRHQSPWFGRHRPGRRLVGHGRPGAAFQVSGRRGCGADLPWDQRSGGDHSDRQTPEPSLARSILKISPCPSVSTSLRNVEEPVPSLCGTTISREQGPCFWRPCAPL